MSQLNTKSSASKEPVFFIGSIPIFGKAFLAPMDGLSDSPLRQVSRRFGSALSISEFVNAFNFVNGHPHRENQIPFDPIERPFAYQIFDNDISRITTTAQYLMKYQPDFIDINMGCSNRAVSNRGAGAGLMREPQKVASLISTLVKEIPVPITAKIRLGWDENELNYLEIAKILEDTGCACITLHARTRVQQYSGIADWDAIAQLVQHVSVPVIGNGDVLHYLQIDEMIAYTQCKAVMIGRGAIGNPWIFNHQDREQIPLRDRLWVMLDHLARMTAYYGADRAPVLFRKFIKHYLKDADLPASFYQKAFCFDSSDKLAQFLQDILQDQ
jgi:nifR3 family TIM-barrel protein